MGGELLRFTREDLEPKEALLEAMPGERAWALLYSPAACAFALWDGAGLAGPEESDPVVEACFEARAWNERGELRWWLRAGKPESAWVSEHSNGPRGWHLDRIQYVAHLDLEYLMWGQATDATSPWSNLVSRRVARLTVPVPSPREGASGYVLAREYHGIDPGPAGQDHGNVVVLEERLTGLEVR